MKQPMVVSASAGPSRVQPSTSLLKAGLKNTHPGLGGLPGGVVGPEAAGLDPSGPEHFFVTLAAYADALDALPLDLTRSFSDLRELDAVLGSHLNSLTARLNHLTALIEDPSIDQGQRLLALKEVAEEARAYKMGGEDKIRVALNTAETIISHTDYIDALDSQLDRFAEISTLLNPTKHLKLDQYYVPGALKDRKLVTSLDGPLGAASGSGAGDINGTGGSKKKKVAAHVAAASAAGKSHKAADTASLTGAAAGASGSSNSKKRKAISGAAVAGSSAGGSSKVAKTSAAGKGDEDVKVAANGSGSHKKKTDSSSHASGGSKASASNSNTRLPRAAHAHIGYTEDDEDARAAASRRGADGEEAAASRSRNSRSVRTAAAHRSDDEDEDMDDPDVEDDDEEDTTARAKNRGRTGGRAAATSSRARGAAAASPHIGSASASRADSPASNAGGAGDDADEARYCFCNNVSYGDMIGCDDDDCEREWFHLGCVGLTKPPQGTWYCEACLERRAANGRGGKAKKGKSSGGSKSKVRR
ncbi:Zinc finger, PHD-finger [Kalmanozyma brasiliensis GHG001]|uniref:Chromatin modification-related protein n=1 Tax=Kalmanozyma brasiliensis (strain GHG001) TaxID=1365824 RepID=V5EM61_KALBG|nr:Zinc finger, PHD-finger [Kalmanozyma brasiliensis GHG001]EST06215.1 Zinc finger, PHD-finger [Kalmanozyma brasiliensis GHG001]